MKSLSYVRLVLEIDSKKLRDTEADIYNHV